MKSSEIRETFLSFFERNDHLRIPSAPLVPSAHDPSVLLTTAGMQPLKPYFQGREQPPAPRLTSCQRCFRTTDIEQVGLTARHLTFFEMLGNFSIGDYFKREAIEFGWRLSLDGFGFDPEQIWVTVFAGDEELGLGPDTESIEIWRGLGVEDERIVRLPRSENFWQAGPTGPCGPCSEMYVDRGESFGGPDDLPGDDTERFLEYWNHVFMANELREDGSVGELPKRSIDTGLGLERMAAIKQEVGSVYETDAFAPLIGLAEEMSGRAYADDAATTRAMRVIADHSRGMTQLIADGVVPSNEDRGYILRRIMRRAIQQGRVLGLEAPYLARFAERAIETMGEAYPALVDARAAIERWVNDEERSFSQTLERGTELLEALIASAKEAGSEEIAAEDTFQLHDTFGFPYDLTKELLADAGLSVDDAGFETLMNEQRQRARSSAQGGGDDSGDRARNFASGAPESRFVGYETLKASTAVAAVELLENGGEGPAEALVKLEESPFYAEGGGQVADSGVLRFEGGQAGVVHVLRIGEDQALKVRLDGSLPKPGDRVEAEVERHVRHATMRNHTATHLLHAALRSRLGTHVRQAGSAVRPDKLRFDFTHGESLSPEDVAAIEADVNDRIKASLPVRALQMSRADAEALGAMALFGEKYGDWVRVVEVVDVSRELCGGTHVANTAEIGLFSIVSEGSSAANVRRVEAITGPAAIDLDRERAQQLREIGTLLGSPQDPLAAARRSAERLLELEADAREAGKARSGARADELVAGAESVNGVHVVVAEGEGADQRGLLELADRVRSKLGEAVVVLGGSADGKVGIVAVLADSLATRGLSAAEIVREAAAVAGGGGGGRATAAQAGGRDPAKLGEALEVAKQAIEAKLA